MNSSLTTLTPTPTSSWTTYLPSAQQAADAYAKASASGTPNFGSVGSTLAGNMFSNACPAGATAAQCLAAGQQIYAGLKSSM
jgi:PAB1-binding protein PBP1